MELSTCKFTASPWAKPWAKQKPWTGMRVEVVNKRPFCTTSLRSGPAEAARPHAKPVGSELVRATLYLFVLEKAILPGMFLSIPVIALIATCLFPLKSSRSPIIASRVKPHHSSSPGIPHTPIPTLGSLPLQISSSLA